MIVSIAIVLACVTAFTIRDSQLRLMDTLLERGQNYAKILIHASSVYVAQQDTHQLNLTAQAATDGNQVQFIAFYSQSGQLLATGAAPTAPDSTRASFDALSEQAQSSRQDVTRWSNGNLEIAKPIVYQGQPVGTVALRFDTQELQTSFNREVLRNVITAVILVVVISVVVGLLLRQFVIVPLRQLSITSDQISAGVWAVPPRQDRTDEFGKVTGSFSQMITALQAREAQLQEQIAAVRALNAELDARVVERTRDLHNLVAQQDQLLTQIRQMSTPVVPVMEGVIVLPIIGSLDTQRADQLIQSVLKGIEDQRAHLAVFDITGVPVVDTHVARVLLHASSAARLLGTTAVIVGIRPEVAQTMVQLGVDLSAIRTFATLQEALRIPSLRGKRA